MTDTDEMTIPDNKKTADTNKMMVIAMRNGKDEHHTDIIAYRITDKYLILQTVQCERCIPIYRIRYAAESIDPKVSEWVSAVDVDGQMHVFTNDRATGASNIHSYDMETELWETRASDKAVVQRFICRWADGCVVNKSIYEISDRGAYMIIRTTDQDIYIFHNDDIEEHSVSPIDMGSTGVGNMIIETLLLRLRYGDEEAIISVSVSNRRGSTLNLDNPEPHCSLDEQIYLSNTEQVLVAIRVGLSLAVKFNFTATYDETSNTITSHAGVDEVRVHSQDGDYSDKSTRLLTTRVARMVSIDIIDYTISPPNDHIGRVLNGKRLLSET